MKFSISVNFGHGTDDKEPYLDNTAFHLKKSIKKRPRGARNITYYLNSEVSERSKMCLKTSVASSPP